VPKKENKAQEKPRETTVEFLASLAAVLVTGLFIITFVLQAFEIPSSSMENTLLIGDHVFVNRVQFAPPTRWAGPLLPYREIRRGDIVGKTDYRHTRRSYSFAQWRGVSQWGKAG
jgi:signal peptidase I